jgi:hypothetical protein
MFDAKLAKTLFGLGQRVKSRFFANPDESSPRSVKQLVEGQVSDA